MEEKNKMRKIRNKKTNTDKKEDNRLKYNKGITLVALVVTIIILIILATITISITLGENGLIKKAEQAKNLYETAEKQDEQSIDNLFKQIEWDKSIVYAKKDKDGNLIPIPNEYYYVEGTKDTGFVISDNQVDENKENSVEGNQFVWVPVEDINEYKLISWNGEIISEEDIEGTDTYHKTAFAHETIISKTPQIIKTREMIGGGNGTSTGYGTDDIEMESIKKYGGFYIGRYEASYDKTKKKIESKKNKIPYTNKTFDILSGRTADEMGNEMTEMSNTKQWKVEQLIRVNTDVGKNQQLARMVSGRQWDAMIKWLNQTRGTSYNTIGHRGSGKIATGSNETYKVNNIYDIAGNIAEYVTDEFYGSNNLQVYRGGNYTLSTLSANMRNNNNGTAEENIGTRLAIILPLPQNDNT